MSKQRATADSWKTKPMPEARKELEIEGSFTAEEFKQISLGFIPQQQEDKWFIYFDGQWLHFHRSWTGTCVFQLQIIPADDHYQAARAVVNRDPDQYRSSDDQHDVTLMSYLIDHLLLGRFAPFPVPQNLSQEDKIRHKKHVMGQDEEGGSSSLSLRIIDNGHQ